jgi:hypothetical protein
LSAGYPEGSDFVTARRKPSDAQKVVKAVMASASAVGLWSLGVSSQDKVVMRIAIRKDPARTMNTSHPTRWDQKQLRCG